MNISALIYLLLFIPFIILFAVFGATFMTAGYKKDLGRSLISLGASIVAVIVSFFTSKLFAWALSKLFGGIITKIVPENNSMMAGLIEGTAAGVIKIVLSLLLFGTFFAITLGVFKTIFKNHLCGAWLDRLNPRASGSKWGGLGVRFVDALLVVIMLSLPLYGTIATVVPPISGILQMSSSQQEDAISPTSAPQDRLAISYMDTAAEPVEDAFVPREPQKSLAETYLDVMKTIESHPVLIPYTYGPGDWVYSGLSSFSMNGNSVDVSRAAETVAGLTERFVGLIEIIDSGDEDVIISKTEDIVSYARDNVIEERWFYNMCMALLSEFDKAMAEDSLNFGSGEQLVLQLRPLFDMSYGEFKSNGVALLDFLEYLLSEENIVMFKGQNDLTYDQTMEKTDEFLTKLGALINHSEQAVAAKQFIYMAAFSSKFSIQDTEPLFKNWGGGKLTDANKQKLDAYLFFELIFKGGGTFDVITLTSMHPLFENESAMLLLQSENVAEQLEGKFRGYVSSSKVASVLAAESVKAKLIAKLDSYKNASITELSLALGDNDLYDFVVDLIAKTLAVDFSQEPEFDYDSEAKYSFTPDSDASLVVTNTSFI